MVLSVNAKNQISGTLIERTEGTVAPLKDSAHLAMIFKINPRSTDSEAVIVTAFRVKL
jgi:hypothetical protein